MLIINQCIYLSIKREPSFILSLLLEHFRIFVVIIILLLIAVFILILVGILSLVIIIFIVLIILAFIISLKHLLCWLIYLLLLWVYIEGRLTATTLVDRRLLLEIDSHWLRDILLEVNISKTVLHHSRCWWLLLSRVIRRRLIVIGWPHDMALLHEWALFRDGLVLFFGIFSWLSGGRAHAYVRCIKMDAAIFGFFVKRDRWLV